MMNNFNLPNSIVDKTMRKISGNAFKIYSFIYRNSNAIDQKAISVKLNQFCEHCGIASKSTVRRAIKEPLELNLIDVKKSIRSNGSVKCTYRCNVEA